jgi:hypothetical protein
MAPSPPLPAVSKPKVVPAADAVEQERMHVLAVDDSNVDRAVIAKILRGSKYRGTVRWVGVGRFSSVHHDDPQRVIEPRVRSFPTCRCACSDRGGLGDAGAGAAVPRPAPRRGHDHHRLLDAGHDGVRAAEARQGVVPAPGDPRRDHVVGERAQPRHPVPGGGSRGLPPQARPPVRRLPPLHPDVDDQMIIHRPASTRAFHRTSTIYCIVAFFRTY